MLTSAVLAVVLSTTPYEINPVVDGVTTGAIFAVLALGDGLVKPGLAPTAICKHELDNGRCDPADLNGLDRSMIDNDSSFWLAASDVGAGASYALPLIFNGIDVMMSGSNTPAADYFTDALVMAESVAVATALTHVLKYAVRRPRPTYYREGAFVGSVEHEMSFPSGHTSSSAAAAFAYATTFSRRHPESGWRYAVYAGAVGLTAFTGYGRIGAGWHFYSDVFAGAIIGAASGLVIPELHAKTELSVEPLVTVGENPSYGAAVRGVF